MTQRADDMQRDPEDAFDKVLRSELRWDVSHDLSAHLCALVQHAPALMAGDDLALTPYSQVVASSVAVPVPQPKRWYVALVTVLTVLAVTVSLMVAWQLYGTVGQELGLTGMWLSFAQWWNAWTTSLFQLLPPQANYAFQLLAGVRSYLYWLLLVAVLWVALDGTAPSFALRQQQTS